MPARDSRSPATFCSARGVAACQAGGDGAAEGGRDSARFTERTRETPRGRDVLHGLGSLPAHVNRGHPFFMENDHAAWAIPPTKKPLVDDLTLKGPNSDGRSDSCYVSY